MKKIEDIIKAYGVKASLSGLTMGIGSVLLFGESVNRSVLGMSVPSYIPIAVAGGMGSLAGDLAHDYVLPHIPQPKKLANLESAGLNFATSGGVFVGSLMALTGIQSNYIPKAFAFGGAVKLGVDSVYHNYLEGPNRII